MTDIIAHRGFSAEAPENTLTAIKRAVELGVDCVEIDLHLSKDGVPVVIHDSALTRTTNIQRPMRVEHLTLEELKELDAGSWFSAEFAGEKIPTLQEVLSIDRGSTKLMLEIKKGLLPAKDISAQILSHISSPDPSIIIGSFEPEIVKAVQEAWPSLIGIVEEPPFINSFIELGIRHLAIWSKIIEPRLIQSLQEKGICVWVFTVDDSKIGKFLHSLGTDGIITNNPKKLQQEVLF